LAAHINAVLDHLGCLGPEQVAGVALDQYGYAREDVVEILPDALVVVRLAFQSGSRWNRPIRCSCPPMPETLEPNVSCATCDLIASLVLAISSSYYSR
jgi:hypothetical protein